MTTELTIKNDYQDAVVQFLVDSGLNTSVDDDVTPEQQLSKLVQAVGEMFSLQEPQINGDLKTTLTIIARDSKLSHIMREKSLYKLWLVTTTMVTVDDGNSRVPMWYGTVNDDGELVTTQEDFVRLFTSKSGISRASAFRRLRVYNQLSQFGVPGQDAWLSVLKMPYTVQDLMTDIASWNRGKFVGVERDVAVGVAKRVMPEQVGAIEEAFESDPPDPDEVLQAYSPVVRRMLDETVTYEDAKEALHHIKHDILGAPTFLYRWRPDEESIEVTARVPVIENGALIDERTTTSTLFLDTVSPENAVLKDLLERLPITNRHDLPDYLT